MVGKNGANTLETFRPGEAPLTATYVPTVYGSVWSYFSKTPPFTLLNINNMLADFRIRWGLWMIKGPMLTKAKFFVKCEDPVVKEFLINEVTRFWRTSAMRAMKALEWGFSCSEALYKMEEGLIKFNYLKDLHSTDCRVLTIKGSVAAARINRVPRKQHTDNNNKLTLYGPRKFWHVHGRELHPFYGQSRLYGAYLPWMEIWTDGGYRDSRRLFFHKYAFDGGGIYVPPGTTNVGDDGSGRPRSVPNMVLGRDVVEKKKSGGVTILPGDTDESGKRKWESIPPSVQPAPAGLMEYGETLKDEMWEGMGIPPEIGRAQGTGAYAGRIVPLIGFYSSLQELIYWLISDADEQIFRPEVRFNFGDVPYEIIPFSILDEAMSEENSDGSSESGFMEEEQPVNQEPPKMDAAKKGSKLSLDQVTRAYEFLLPFSAGPTASYNQPNRMVF